MHTVPHTAQGNAGGSSSATADLYDAAGVRDMPQHLLASMFDDRDISSFAALMRELASDLRAGAPVWGGAHKLGWPLS